MFKKKSFLILLIIVVLILVAIFVFNDKEESSQVEENFTMDESEVIAQSWVENNAPTYKFDGENLTLKDSHKVGLKEVSSDTPQGSESSCQDCYEFSFEFTSRHAGYGERDGQMLAQVITPHVINVTVESGQVTRAVTDEKF